MPDPMPDPPDPRLRLRRQLADTGDSPHPPTPAWRANWPHAPRTVSSPKGPRAARAAARQVGPANWHAPSPCLGKRPPGRGPPWLTTWRASRLARAASGPGVQTTPRARGPPAHAATPQSPAFLCAATSPPGGLLGARALSA
ncbi:hypothetical protein N7493_009386 [Penicillium malachiteum]|uniref:Uncharacterized protein n=1 Tax=Penicillium malachiteum TaxID=1324776 RepID=A0AAD6HF66_9EURO|nr:hypothetical protein N7493_009386 [Penicillium malachiteum]